ncbi:hypothetical protein [Antrihabitans spumae]|uniref:Uncharacterized protein n=1 Tax=Antrihabitans spumae TaxID=3373370 RepID=A0ABW7KAP9_9NOCA
MIATRVLSDSPNFMGNWGLELEPRLYQLDPPLDGYHYVAVLVCDIPSIGLDRTDVFAAYPNGAAAPHPDGGLAPQRSYPLCSHANALSEMGYVISDS